jgi:hypothetical protein
MFYLRERKINTVLSRRNLSEHDNSHERVFIVF